MERIGLSKRSEPDDIRNDLDAALKKINEDVDFVHSGKLFIIVECF